MRQRRTAYLHLAVAWMAALVGATAQAQTQAQAQADTPPPVEAFFAAPDLGEPSLSPSGRHLAVLVPGQGGRNALAVLDLTDTRQSRVLTRFNEADIRDLRWVDDDWLVFSVHDLQAGSGEHELGLGLFSISRHGEGLRTLVKPRQTPLVVERPSGIDRRLEANHQLLAIPRDGSREVIVGEANLKDGALDKLAPRRLNVETGRARRIEGLTPSQAWMFDSMGEARVAIDEDAGRLKVRWREPGSTAWRQLLDADALTAPWVPHSLDTAGRLYVTDRRGDGGTRVLARYDFEKGAPAVEPMVVVPGFDFQGFLVADLDSAQTLGVRVLSDGETTVWLDPKLKALQAEVDQRLPGRSNRVTCRRCSSDERVVLIDSFADVEPGTLYVLRGQKDDLQLVGRRQQAIDPARMAALDLHRFQARDGRMVPVWMTEPRRRAGAPPPPAVVLVHGGPWLRGGAWYWDPLPQFLASRGYAVIEPEFRGSTGYGSDHFRAGWRQWGQAMQDDVTDAVRWAAASQRVDGRRVCIIGGSYGGYATLMGLVRDPDVYRCGAAWAAVSEPLRLLEASRWWADDFDDDVRRYELPRLLGDPKQDAEMLKAISPVQQAARIRAPLLLVHGERDVRVPLIHAKAMREALQRHGQEPEWLTFPDEGHVWRKVETQRAFARRLETFLDQHLK